MGALAKRIGHPRIQRSKQALEILERATQHPGFYTTTISEDAYNQIVARLVSLEPPTQKDDLLRLDRALGRLVQKRSFMLLGFPPPSGAASLFECEAKQRGTTPWMNAYADKTPGGVRVMAGHSPESFDYWLQGGFVSEKAALRIAARAVRDLRNCIKNLDEPTAKEHLVLLGGRRSLSLLNQMSAYYTAAPSVWQKMAKSVSVNNMDTWQALTDRFEAKDGYPTLSSGLQRAFLAQDCRPIERRRAQPNL